MNNILFLLVVINVAVGEGDVAEDTLQLVHAIVRHGDRTPDLMMNVSSEWHKGEDYYPFGMGELNKKGVANSYKVGKQLRQRYQTFLNTTYYPGIVEAMSSGYTRCRMTMQILLTAMFPPDSSHTLDNELLWQPIAYKYNDVKADPIICTFMKCLKIFDVSVDNTKLNLSHCENRQWIYEYVTHRSGIKVDSLKILLYIQDTLRSELQNGLELPIWAKAIWPEPLLTCANDIWRYFLDNETRLAYGGGNFMKKIVEDSREKITGNLITKDTKIFLYAVHDYNIYIFLKMLGNYNDIIANYLVYILFEVHNIDGVYGFKIFLDNHDELGLRLLEIPGCGTFCPIDDFYEQMKIYFSPKSCYEM